MPENPPTAAATALPPLTTQAERLIGLGVHELAGMAATELRAFAASAGDGDGAGDGARDVLLAVHPDRAPASALAPLLRHDGKPGFVVTDMPDVDRFAPLETVDLPDARHWPRPRRPQARCCSPRASTGCSSSLRSWSATTAS